MREILAADIGGTSARFAHFLHEPGTGLALLHSIWLKTADFEDFAGLCQAAQAEIGLRLEQADASVFAVAGPINDNSSCKAPNIPYALNLADLPEIRRGLLINDFTAQAQAMRSPLAETCLSVLPGKFDGSKVQAVIGPGTGLGKAAIVPLPDGGYSVLASEGGHASLSFYSREEYRFCDFALARLGEPYLRGDSLLSGSGLRLLHLYLSGEDLKPAEILSQAGPDSPTLAWFARFLGRAARNFCLEVLALGGLYVSGGVAARNPAILAHAEFAREFRLSPSHAELLSGIGVRLCQDQQAGLWGAAQAALSLF